MLAQRIIPELESETEPKLGHDSSTNKRLIRRYRKLKERPDNPLFARSSFRSLKKRNAARKNR